jgi:hypothetical protein
MGLLEAYVGHLTVINAAKYGVRSERSVFNLIRNYKNTTDDKSSISTIRMAAG